MQHIRNFSIIAHIDHGKSTLADRMLEITHTVEARKMHDRVLDDMELEKERGITIKMRPVRMEYKNPKDGQNYVLNLIDTPGHIDFYYEVSRALKAVEGSILLVDATQGVQAQTLTTLAMARETGLVIIPVITKIDSPLSRVDEVKYEMIRLLDCKEEDIVCVSGRTGEGVDELLQEVIRRVPSPKTTHSGPKDIRALIFDFQYSTHTGVIVFVRLLDGKIKKNDPLLFKIANEKFSALEVGTFNPQETPKDELSAGEIGYIVTGIKRPGIASVGDTITHSTHPLPELHGYMTPKPVVWASIYSESQDDFNNLRQALERLRLSDSSYAFEEESSGTLGRGFRCGFLGMLHLEIITERLRREFNLELIVTTPSITYIVTNKQGKKEIIYSPSKFPEYGEVAEVEEPWVSMTIITPPAYISPIMQTLFDHEAEIGDSENFGDDRASIKVMMPLRELMRNFFDEIKSVTSGYASLSYEIGEFRKADVCRLDILINGEPMLAFTRIVSKRRVVEDARKAAEKLQKVMPQQMIIVKIQAQALGKIIASETLSALRKDVTQHMYGGDITRKMKLREKQKKGKKKMQEMGAVNIPHEVFLKMVKGGE
ncbi:MAG: translation elongation factor 4 [bacterium]